MRLRLFILAALTAGAMGLAGVFAQEDEGPEVQARGPVHEAFGESSDPIAGAQPVVAKAPPDPVEEVPPEEKPEGDHVVWIPGYWAWDEVDEDFLWVSGFWRAVPPGRAWVPGHWQEVKGGYQWVSGYWSEEGESEKDVEYLPEPPESLERGPSARAPSEEYIYVPGVWLYQVTKYAWRPGFWFKFRPGWVWVPDCYKWTPAGYLFVPGYWDAPLCERGLLFAPVRFTGRAHLRRDYVYRPSYVVQPDFLVGSLFVRNATRTYYFGDYFDPKLRKRYVPWVEHHIARDSNDVNFAYYHRAFAKHAAWERASRRCTRGATAATCRARRGRSPSRRRRSPGSSPTAPRIGS